MVRHIFWICSIIFFAVVIGLGLMWHWVFYFLIILIPLFLVGIYDIVQRKSNVLRLYPLIGHLRYWLQDIRPQIQQYFIETNTNGAPFSREDREIVYQRSNRTLDTLPFGTQRDVHAPGFESINQSLHVKVVPEEEARIIVGGPGCKQKYNASRLNVSAMSYGAISKNAVRALNRGAKLGNFAQNTGEGGLSPYHLMEGGDVFWQVASGYFGCRTKEGRFNDELFQEKAAHPSVKMIEIKLSQGAKPGHGGVLPAVKITPEISEIRGVEMGKDCVSPANHPEFSTPRELVEFIIRLRELSGGKPIGFKLCIGSRAEFLGICKAMIEMKTYPDFITVDGAEGGTGAAPVEFTDYLGFPLNEGLAFVRNALVGTNLREHIRIIASGKVISGFDMITKFALGADMCNSARGMMFALGCIQSRRCNKNTCPTGVATQKPDRVYALDIDDKAPRVRNFHDATIESAFDVLGAAGLDKIADLTPDYLYRRISHSQVMHFDEIYPFIEPGALFTGEGVPDFLMEAWEKANPDYFCAASKE